MTLGPGYFDEMYAAAPDPWSLRTRWYEPRKYAMSIAMLPRQRYRDAFEPGCSVGVLTGMLAPRCDRLLSCDVAAGRGEDRGRTHRILSERHGRAPGHSPGLADGRFDLIVLSEFLYYFAGATWMRLSTLPSRRSGLPGPFLRCTGGTWSPTTRAAATTCTRP